MKTIAQLKRELEAKRLAKTVGTIRRKSKAIWVFREYGKHADPVVVDCRKIKTENHATTNNATRFTARAAICELLIREGADKFIADSAACLIHNSNIPVFEALNYGTYVPKI